MCPPWRPAGRLVYRLKSKHSGERLIFLAAAGVLLCVFVQGFLSQFIQLFPLSALLNFLFALKLFILALNTIFPFSLRTGWHRPKPTMDSYIGTRVRIEKRSNFRRDPKDEARQLLLGSIFAHVPVVQFDFRPKCVYVAVIVRRIILAMKDEVRGKQTASLQWWLRKWSICLRGAG